MNKSPSLRSVKLIYNYDYSNISTYTSISSNIKSLELLISDSPNKISVYSILPILRVCHRIRYLHAIIKHEISSQNNNFNVLFEEPFINENDLPISPQVTSFDLSIFAQCDIRSIACILRCMPNLIHFKFLHGIREVSLSFLNDLVNGYTWQHMFEIHVPLLSKFDFHMLIENKYRKLNLDMVVNSFQYFVKIYPKWHMIIDRWTPDNTSIQEIVMLRTFGYQKYKRNVHVTIPMIVFESFETRSTKATTNDHYLYYSDTKYLKLDIEKITPRITFFPLFQHINSLVVHYYPVVNFSGPNNSLYIVNSVQSNDNDDSQQYVTSLSQQRVTSLSHIVHLPNVNQINFEPWINVGQGKDIQFILQACPNVFDLQITPTNLVSSKFIDNRSLFSIFKQIKILNAVAEDHCVAPSFLSKLVQRFPSLTDIELHVLSFDDFICVIDILLSHLKHLSYLKIYYINISSFDHPFSRSYIIDKRRQAFGFNIIDEHKITVSKNEESVEIRLS